MCARNKRGGMHHTTVIPPPPTLGARLHARRLQALCKRYAGAGTSPPAFPCGRLEAV